MNGEKVRNPVDIAERLKEFMDSRGLTQDTLADALGVSSQTVSGWLTRRRSINATELQKIALKYNVSADYLLHLETPPVKLLAEEEKRLNNERTKILNQLSDPNYKEKWTDLTKKLKIIQQELSDVEVRLASAKFDYFTPTRVPVYTKIESITPDGIVGDQIGYAYTPVPEVTADVALKVDKKIFFVKLVPNKIDYQVSTPASNYVFTLSSDNQITTVNECKSVDGVVTGQVDLFSQN